MQKKLIKVFIIVFNLLFLNCAVTKFKNIKELVYEKIFVAIITIIVLTFFLR